jgi:CRISPR-associated protein Cas2
VKLVKLSAESLVLGHLTRAAMFIVVAYDISDDRRRTRLFKTLRRFGDPVQFSVFECVLSERQFEEMRRAVAELIEPGDKVRYYDICVACRKETVTLGRAVTTKDRLVYIL